MKQRNYVQKALLKLHPKSGVHCNNKKSNRIKEKLDLKKELKYNN